MSNPSQPFDGPNGSYSICSTCGARYGTPPEGAIGMWRGICDLCSTPDNLSNALHDWNITDRRCHDLRRKRGLEG